MASLKVVEGCQLCRERYLLSGQRQRIGIARGFYKQAKVLVFDEATMPRHRYGEGTYEDIDTPTKS